MTQFPDWENPYWYDEHHNAWFNSQDKEQEFYDCAWEALPGLHTKNSLLEVGAGTGKFTEGVIQRYPKLSRLTLVDTNEDRLELARERLELKDGRSEITFLKSRLEDLELIEKFDVVVCMHTLREALLAIKLENRALSVNWLKENVSKIYNMLTEDGMFLWGDEVGYVETQSERSANTSILEAWEIMEVLRNTGFVKVECIYRYRNLAIHRALKSGSKV